MATVTIVELKRQLSKHLRAVERGADIVVTDRGRPIARISQLPANAPRVRLVPPTRSFPAVRDRRRTRSGWSIDSTTMLLEERGER